MSDKKLSDRDLSALKIDYEAKIEPLSALVERYGVCRSTILSLATKYDWRKRKVAKLPPKPRGRPSKLTALVIQQVEKLCLLGLNNQEIADFLGINTVTFYDWMSRHPDFSNAIIAGRAPANAEVAASAYKRAIGYEIDEEKIMPINGEPVRLTVKKHFPPDARVGLEILARRYPDRWRETKNIDLTARALRLELPPAEPIETDEEFQQLVESQKPED